MKNDTVKEALIPLCAAEQQGKSEKHESIQA